LKRKGLAMDVLPIRLLRVSVLLSTLTPCVAAEFAVPLTVRDEAGLAREAEPVRGGVPFPQGAVRSKTEVALRDPAGRLTAAQFRPLATWPDGSIRWLLVDFLARVPASGQSVYTLVPRMADAPAPASPLTVDVQEALITVVTGPLKFTVHRKRFDLIHEAWLDLNGDGQFAAGERVVAPSPASGFVLRTGPRVEVVENRAKYFDFGAIRPVQGVAQDETWTIRWTKQGERKGTTFNDFYEVVGDKTGPDGTAKNYDRWTTTSGALRLNGPLQTYPVPGTEYVVFRVIASGDEYRLDTGDLSAVVVEEQGPVRVVIRAEGVLRTASGKMLGTQKDERVAPRAVLRLHACAGRSEVAVSCQVRSPRNNLDLAEGSLSLALAGKRTGGRLWKYDVGTDDAALDLARARRGSGDAARVVDLTRLSRGGDARVEQVETGAGAAVLSGEAGELAVFQRYAERNQPQRLEFAGPLLKASLWPTLPTTHRLATGTQKTYEMQFSFSCTGGADWEERLKRVAHPLVPQAPPAWYADTLALGQIAEVRPPSSLPDEVRQAYVHFEKVQRAKVDGTLVGTTANPAPTVMSKTYSTWQDFGNLPWADGACNLHYDWPWSMLLHYVRTGDRRFFDAGEVLAWCRRDRIQIWDFAGPAYGRLARYEKSFGAPNVTHTWTHGLFLYYYLTGDPGALEAAMESTEGVRQYWFDWGYAFAGQPDKKIAWEELRAPGWSIDNLLNAYEYTGERVWLERAARLFRDCLLFMDERTGKAGMCHLPNKSPRLSPLMAGYLVEPLCRLHFYLTDAKDPLAKDLLDFMRRMYVGVVREKMVLGGTTAGGSYVPLTFTYDWQPDRQYTLKQADQGIYTQFFANAYATLYLAERKPEYLAWARQFFRDGMSFVPLAFECPAYFPGTETKIHGWSGRTNQIYLFMEKAISGEEAAGKRQ
jgi:hypothetical protein